MISKIEFSVELDDLAIERGLEHCVQVNCYYEVSFTYDRFDKPTVTIDYTELKHICDDDGLDLTGKLSENDMKKIERYLDQEIEDHGFYDDYVAAQEAKAESMIGDR